MIENFKVFHVGPALAFNLNKYGTTAKGRERIEFLINSGCIKKHQAVLLTFGEVDCRVHVIKQAEKLGGDFRPVVDKIIANYLEFLKYLSENHPVYIWGPIPSQNEKSVINPAFPRYGTEEQRNRATEYFNERLKEICEANGFKFFSVFKYLIDENYLTREEYISDGCHLSQKAWEFAAEEFQKQGIKINFSSRWPDFQPPKKLNRYINGVKSRVRFIFRKMYSLMR